jgi:dihydropteroate synthase-like protein
MAQSQWLFVTGKLAEASLRQTLAELKASFAYSVAVLPITVAALATTEWIARHLTIPSGINSVLLPGLCQGDLEPLRAVAGIPVERGPKDLRDLPEYFGQSGSCPADYGVFDVEILAEINDTPRLPSRDLLEAARRFRAAGADVIDLGCDPGSSWAGIGEAVRALRAEGMRVSVDSFDAVEVEAAVRAGAELVLSVNSSNVAGAQDWGCEVVAVPDVPATLEGLDATIESLRQSNVPFRIDPVLEPIGFGFAASLGRYLEIRRRYPDAAMLMGVGNVTELTDVDSAGVNVMLVGFCQEVGIRSVLTTEVINWCRSCVRELDLARRLVHYAVTHHVLPKRLETDLVILRDPKLRQHGDKALHDLAAKITDRSFRLFAERGLLHVLNGHMLLEGDDPFVLFEEMQRRAEINSSHAFYLGYEMAKAVTSLTLGKNYVQDEALRWGFLREP